jgi:predicted RecB family nuclease
MGSVKNVIEAQLVKREPRPSKQKWRGSLLGGCVRAHWYDANSVPETEPFEDKLFGIFKVGNVLGEVIVDILKESGELVKIDPEVPVEVPEWNFAGNIDAVVEWKDGKRSVLEFKTESSFARKFRKGEPKREHMIQSSSYAAVLDHLGTPVDDVRVVYIEKDTFSIDEYIIPPEWKDRALRTIGVLNYYGDRIPPRIPDAWAKSPKGELKYPCSYCRWKTACRSSR